MLMIRSSKIILFNKFNYNIKSMASSAKKRVYDILNRKDAVFNYQFPQITLKKKSFLKSSENMENKGIQIRKVMIECDSKEIQTRNQVRKYLQTKQNILNMPAHLKQHSQRCSHKCRCKQKMQTFAQREKVLVNAFTPQESNISQHSKEKAKVKVKKTPKNIHITINSNAPISYNTVEEVYFIPLAMTQDNSYKKQSQQFSGVLPEISLKIQSKLHVGQHDKDRNIFKVDEQMVIQPQKCQEKQPTLNQSCIKYNTHAQTTLIYKETCKMESIFSRFINRENSAKRRKSSKEIRQSIMICKYDKESRPKSTQNILSILNPSKTDILEQKQSFQAKILSRLFKKMQGDQNQSQCLDCKRIVYKNLNLYELHFIGLVLEKITPQQYNKLQMSTFKVIGMVCRDDLRDLIETYDFGKTANLPTKCTQHSITS